MKTMEDYNVQELRDLTQKFLASLRSGDPATFYSFLDDYIDDDTELITSEGEIIKGDDLIPFYHEFFDPVFISYDADGGFYDDEYILSGDLAVHRYSYKIDLKPREGGPIVTEIGHGIKIYKKHIDGGWRLQYDIWTNPQ